MKTKTTKSPSRAKREKRLARLIGKPQAVMDQEDSFLSALSNLALDTPKTQLREGRNSRFWIRVGKSPSVDPLEAAKASVAPKKIEHVDQVVEDRLLTYRKEMPSILGSHIDLIREFFLTEIAPLTMASSGGALQSREVASRLLGTEIDSAIFSKFENMVSRAATLKMASFVIKYFDLPQESLSSILGAQGGGSAQPSPLEREVKAILDHLQTAPSRKDLKSLSESVRKLQTTTTQK